jgi:membrane protease YdiL (CAAX protease family)
VVGVILAILYERTGSLIPGIVLHALINSLATLGALLSA